MVIKKDDIEKIIRELNTRGLSLYHACQLKDFISYMKLGAIPSRKVLVDKGQNFTGFESDLNDKSNGVWDKVFFNLEDFGKIFHKNSAITTPNVYGPILIKMSPDALADASDISITLRSAGASDFNRDRESLSSFEEFIKLFSYPSTDRYRKTWFKSKKVLAEEFKDLNVKSSPEINCTYDDNIFTFGKVSVDYITEILVDPLSYKDNLLVNHVKKASGIIHPALSEFVIERQSMNKIIYDAFVLSSSLYSNSFSKYLNSIIPKLEGSGLLSEEGLGNIKLFQEKSHFYQFPRFMKYLNDGTLEYLALDDDSFKALMEELKAA